MKKSKIYNSLSTVHDSNMGFTLIETITTAFIVSVLMMVVGSAFVSALNLQRRAFNVQQVQENGSYIMESIAKEIRVASSITTADTNCANPSQTLAIVHPVNGAVGYTLNGTNVQRTENGASSTINSNQVQFTRLQFCVYGNGGADLKQPRVTILATLRSTSTQRQATIDIQTTISLRNLQESLP